MAVHKARGTWESRAKTYVFAILSLIALSLAGCTLFGNQAATTPSISVTLSPGSVSVPAGHTQQFTAAVGGWDTGVTWSASGGSITSGGMYTAPNSAGSFLVTATSIAPNTVSTSAAVTVTPAVPVSISPVSVSISPASASLVTNGTQQLTATVSGSSNTAVTWSATGGSVSSSGLYTAPSTAGTFTVKATSVADNTKSASATVTVSTTPVIAVTTSPISASMLTSGTQQFAATVSGSSNTAVTWSATGGSVSSSGLYTAPSTAGTVTVKATSVADNTKSAAATVTVSATTLSITTSSLNNGVVGTPYQATLAATGGTAPYSWRLSAGQLPPGLALGTNSALAGTPTTVGQFSFSVQVADSGFPHQTTSQTFSMSIAADTPPLTISTSSLAGGIVGTAYSATLVASGGTPAYTWNISSGQLPPGLTLAATTGVISGTPSSNGSFSFTATVVDSSSPQRRASQAYGPLSIVTNPATGQPCGSTSTSVVLPDNYDNPSPPAIGSYYTGQFGCRALRVADGVNNTGLITPFSQNDTYFLLTRCTTGGVDSTCLGHDAASLRVYQINGDGPTTQQCNLGNLGIGDSSDPVWATSNEWQLWYHGSGGLNIGYVDVRDCTSHAWDTISRSGFSCISFQGGQGDISDDGDHLLLTDYCNGNPVLHAAVYTISTKALGPNFSNALGGHIGISDYSKGGPILSDNTAMIMYSNPTSADEIYSGATGNFLRDLTPGTYFGHVAAGRDSDGSPIVVAGTDNLFVNPCSFWASVLKMNTQTAVGTCLLTGGGTADLIGGHYSLNNQGTARYNVLVSNEAGNLDAQPAPVGWQTSWKAFTDELILVPLDGSGIARRLIHHQSRRFTGCGGNGNCYYNSPRASISRSGRYVLYTSNFGQGAGDGGWSVYLMKVW